jgi:hypothetical protein
MTVRSMALGRRLLLGRKQTTRAGYVGQTRLCPVCGERRAVKEFQIRRRSERARARLNVYCNPCRLNNREGVRRFFASGQPVAKVNRRELIKLMRELARRRIQKGRVGIHMTAEEYAVKAAKLPDRIAAVVAKTYAVQGDAAQIADDQALMMVRDLLDELDDTLIERNKNKRLIRRSTNKPS